ncbi:tetraspanin-3-like isoform X1 [Xiphophorus maculatus]|nr:tetraspanin-3-like isoform X1 [Xiphophorus maculatus]
MGKVNVLLKRSYVCTISVIAITAVLTLGITVFSHGVLLDEEDVHIFKGIYSLYGISVIPLLFAIIGGFGVWKEKKWALIVFAVGMILGCLFFIVLEISLPFAYQQMELMVKNKYLSLLPLSNLSESELSELDYTQSEFHCCGLTSLEDWENDIPESCQCDMDSSDECVDTYGSMRNDSGLNFSNVKPIRIYAKPCLPVLIQLGMSHVSIFIGITLAKTLLWMQVWDTAGQERFRTITQSYYRSAHGAMIAYDVTRGCTFDSVDHWIKEVELYGAANVLLVLIGNKCDLEEEREVPFEKACNLAKERGILAALETSAKESQNVEEAFLMMARELLSRNGLNVQQDEVEGNSMPRILLRENSRPINVSMGPYVPPEKEKKSCC